MSIIINSIYKLLNATIGSNLEALFAGKTPKIKPIDPEKFLETIEKPVVVTFHSALPNPDRLRKKVVSFICDKSTAIVVMAKKAMEILRDDYDVDEKGYILTPSREKIRSKENPNHLPKRAQAVSLKMLVNLRNRVLDTC